MMSTSVFVQSPTHMQGCWSRCSSTVQETGALGCSNFKPTGRFASRHAVTLRCLGNVVGQRCMTSRCRRVETAAVPLDRRTWLLGSTLILLPGPAHAVGFTKELKKKKIPIEDYSISEVDGLRFYDLTEGTGAPVSTGDKVTVHFDCLFKSLDVVSTRSARLLAGNRVVAEVSPLPSASLCQGLSQDDCAVLLEDSVDGFDNIYLVPEPFTFKAGGTVDLKAMRMQSDIAGAAMPSLGGPQAPAALSTAVIGMKKGGRRSVIVTPELGYGDKGLMEIPPNAQFELQIELLEVL